MNHIILIIIIVIKVYYFIALYTVYSQPWECGKNLINFDPSFRCFHSIFNIENYKILTIIRSEQVVLTYVAVNIENDIKL